MISFPFELCSRDDGNTTKFVNSVALINSYFASGTDGRSPRCILLVR
jgi:hypothetical protein